MARQLDLLGSGQVIPTSLHAEMQRSYLEYAMSVIVGRALPDARDGLKPVHRRILYAMHELGLTPDRPYRKCARVVGDVLGKYHPHGDQAVYDALVRMVQSFASRYPLLQGHGNFGSVDNDPAAAMRYTETRLAPVGDTALLSEIGQATVDFAPNFDNSQQEPTVLPAQLPFLLLNGCAGIAVGMATNVPPHNLSEVVDGAIALIDRPDLSDERLWELIPGPDFPTGGEIVGSDGIRDAYRTGRGSIAVRGVARVEEIPGGRGRQRRTAIVIVELPFQVNKAAWLEKVANLTNQGRLEGIGDLRDESDREGMRVVVELKREAQPAEVLQQLYRQTDLQTNFGAILLALVDGQPQQLGLRSLLQAFLDFRETTLTRQYRHELGQAENRLEILAGLLQALENLDDVIDILRHAPDGGSAKAQFLERLSLSERQADAVLAMPLRRLTGLERQNLQSEYDELQGRIARLQQLLGERRELLKALKKELRSLKKKFGDPRRTRIVGDAELAREAQEAARAETADPASAAPEEAVVEITDRGYARRLSLRAFQRQQRRSEGDGDAGAPVLEDRDDPVVQTAALSLDRELLVLTRSGKAYTIAAATLPTATRKAPKGSPLVTLLPSSVRKNALQGGDDAVAQLAREVVAYFPLTPEVLPAEAIVRRSGAIDPDDLPPESRWDLVLLTQQGRVKRLPLAEFSQLTGRGLTALKLKDDDELALATLARPGDRLVTATASGRVLQFPLDDEQLPVANRNSQGVQAIALQGSDRLVGCAAARASDDLLLVTERAYAKRMPAGLLRQGKRGQRGGAAIQFALKSDSLAVLAAIAPQSRVLLLTSAGRAAAVAADRVPVLNQTAGGDRLFRLGSGETIVRAAVQPELSLE